MTRGKEGEKKARTTPTNTSLLPPCKVCLEPAAGFHYGVNTCEACKGFFRRSLLRDKPYKCLGSGNCNIRAGKRHICPKCRYRRCLAVGMSKEAIKTGRYTHAKRTQDILEYQEMVKITTVAGPPLAAWSSLPTAIGQHGSTCCKSSSPSSPDVTTTSKTCHGADPGTGGSGISHISLESKGSLMAGLLEPAVLVSPPVDIPDSMLDDAGREDEAVSLLSIAPSSPVSHLPKSSEGSEGWFDISPSPESCCPLADIDVSPLVGKSQSWPAASESSEMSGGLSDSSSSQSPLELSLETQDRETISLSVDKTREEDLSDEECASIVRHLLYCHASMNTMPSDHMSEQELLKKQVECYEACQAKAALFHCKTLSKEEYLDFYSKTGLDIDNRQWFMEQHLVSMLDVCIRKYIAFCKTIPGFSELTLRDQINLVKNNRCEFRMLSSFSNYNFDLKVITMESGRTVCYHEASKILGEDHIQQRFACASTLHKLGLSREEVIVLKSVVIVSVGGEDVDDPAKVSAIQWRMAQCLLWLLKQTRAYPNPAFAHIISKLCYVREMSVGLYTWLKSNPLELFKSLQDNALTAEWFSSV